MPPYRSSDGRSPSSGQTLYGGNIQAITNIGIDVLFGSVQVVISTGSQLCVNWDIKIHSTASGPIARYGCRSESPHHVYLDAATPGVLSGVSYQCATGGGVILEAHGLALLEASLSSGVVAAREGALLTLQNVTFPAAGTSFLDAPAASLWFTPTNTYSANIELEGIKYNADANIIRKERRFTTNGTAITTQNYVLI
jgi:hypothetical protein